MSARIHFFIVLFLLAISTQTTNAGISQHIAYQGVLTDTAGNPRPDGEYAFTFQLYDDSAAGTALWSEIKTLYVNKGIFSTFLGNATPFGSTLKFDKPYWLSIKVGSSELTPRIPFGSVAYSLRSQWADTAEYARGAAGGDLIGAFPSPTIDSGVVTSKKIADGTIQRVDVAAGFKAPFADTADFSDSAFNAYGVNQNVGCFVSCKSDQNIPKDKWTQIEFDSTHYNFGDHFSISNHTFTCPFDGYYEVYIHVAGKDFAETALLELQVLKNYGNTPFTPWARDHSGGGPKTPHGQNVTSTASLYYVVECDSGEILTGDVYHYYTADKEIDHRYSWMMIGLKYRK